jgi:hypothetical protein
MIGKFFPPQQCPECGLLMTYGWPTVGASKAETHLRSRFQYCPRNGCIYSPVIDVLTGQTFDDTYLLRWQEFVALYLDLEKST